MAEKHPQLFPGDPGPDFKLPESEDYGLRANLFLDQIPGGMIPQETILLLRQSLNQLGGPNGMSLRAFVDYSNQTIEAAGFDAVTGLPNRRVFEVMLEKNVAEARRGVVPLALALFDIDNFKKVNNRYGHLGGDKKLQEIAAVITQNTRGSDIVARIGGDELAVIMPDAFQNEEGELLKRVNEIRKKIQDVSVSRLGRIGTVSIGIAVLGENMSSTDLYSKADRAAYKSKNKGRDRVTYLE